MRTVLAALIFVGVTSTGPASAQQPQQLPGITVTAPPPPKAAPKPALRHRPKAPAPAPAPRQPVSAIQSLDPSANDVGKAQSGSQGVGPARAARDAADLSHGRGARGGAGAGRHPAQRRGQGQPVFPARLQSRPRHRPRHHRRRHAGQHAHPRPRPGLCRHQLPDPRADRAACVYRKGPYFADGGRLRLGRRGRTSTYVDRLPEDRRQIGSAASATARAARGLSVPVGAGTLLAAGEIVRYDGPVGRPDELRKLNGVLRYARAPTPTASRSPRMAYATAGTPPTRSRSARSTRASSAASAPSIPPTAATRTATACRRDGAQTDADGVTRSTPTSSTTTLDAVQQLHLLPQRPGQRRPVRADRRPHRAGGSASQTLGPVTGRPSRSRPRVGVQTRYDDITSACINTAASGSRCPPCATTRSSESSVGALRREHDRVDAAGCAPWPACAPTSTGRRGEQPAPPTRATTSDALAARSSA